MSVSHALRRFLSKDTAMARRILVALSGGPDSVALLEATLAESRILGLVVAACWVDHGIRPVDEIAAEYDFVQELCAELGVELFVKTADRGQIEAAAKSEGGLESAARRFRYEALEMARVESRSDIVLTGHTSDDFMETMVMRLCTGSGSAGLGGIPSVSGFIHRPMLSVSKADVLQYLASIGRTYRTDSTNAGCDYLRNKVRHIVIPSLYSVFPFLDSSLSTLAAKARLDDAALQELAAALIQKTSVSEPGGESPYIDADAFDGSPVAVRTRALYALCPYTDKDRIPWRLILAAATAGKASGRLASGAGLEFVKDAGRVLVRRLDGSHGSRSKSEDSATPQTGSSGFSLLVEGFGTYRIGKTLVCRIYSTQHSPGLRMDAFSWPLCIRSRRSGDALAIKGGHKTLDALGSEQHIPAHRRGEMVVVEDAGGIVAVLSSSCGGRDSYRLNDGLAGTTAKGFMVLELKGVSLHDAIRR
jgi:tRNA(Ile)-lysidine synthase